MYVYLHTGRIGMDRLLRFVRPRGRVRGFRFVAERIVVSRPFHNVVRPCFRSTAVLRAVEIRRRDEIETHQSVQMDATTADSK